MYLKIFFIPTNPILAAMSFFSFSSKIPYAYFLDDLTPKKKLRQMSYCNVQTMQTKFARFCQKGSGYDKLDPPKIWRNRRACL